MNEIDENEKVDIVDLDVVEQAYAIAENTDNIKESVHNRMKDNAFEAWYGDKVDTIEKLLTRIPYYFQPSLNLFNTF